MGGEGDDCGELGKTGGEHASEPSAELKPVGVLQNSWKETVREKKVKKSQKKQKGGSERGSRKAARAHKTAPVARGTPLFHGNTLPAQIEREGKKNTKSLCRVPDWLRERKKYT